MNDSSAVTEATFRELARSSHRLWDAIEFEHTNPDRGTVHAWIRRPFDLRVETSDGDVIVEHRGSSGSMLSVAFDGPMPAMYSDAEAALVKDPDEPFDPDRPPSPEAERQADGTWMEGDPLYENYQWVAMLQPRELAHGGLHKEAFEAAVTAGLDPEAVEAPGVLIHRLSAGQRQGRDTWWAELSPDDDTYESRCGCCPLLLCEVSERLEYDGELPSRMSDLRFAYTTRFLVALDVETGICVSVEHLDGSRTGEAFSVRIFGVNEPMDDGLFTTPPWRQ